MIADSGPWVVVCRGDKERRGGRLVEGRYVLATRRVFEDYASAAEYARGVAPGREAIAVAGRWFELRREVTS